MRRNGNTLLAGIFERPGCSGNKEEASVSRVLKHRASPVVLLLGERAGHGNVGLGGLQCGARIQNLIQISICYGA